MEYAGELSWLCDCASGLDGEDAGVICMKEKCPRTTPTKALQSIYGIMSHVEKEVKLEKPKCTWSMPKTREPISAFRRKFSSVLGFSTVKVMIKLAG